VRLAKEASLFDSPISLNIAIMKGFFNQLLRINLSDQKSVVEPIPESILRSYLIGTPRSEGDAKGVLPIEGLGLGPLPQILKMVKFIYSKEKTCVWEA
jgi:hypothetical protein